MDKCAFCGKDTELLFYTFEMCSYCGADSVCPECAIEDHEDWIGIHEETINEIKLAVQKLNAESSGKPYCPKCFTFDVLYIKNMPTENKMVCRKYGCFYDGSEEEFHYQC